MIRFLEKLFFRALPAGVGWPEGVPREEWQRVTYTSAAGELVAVHGHRAASP